MPISGKKSGMVLSVALRAAMLSLLLIQIVHADARGGRRSRQPTNAEKISFHKEELADSQDRLEELEERKRSVQERMKAHKRYETSLPDDVSTIRYSTPCDCGLPVCTTDDYEGVEGFFSNDGEVQYRSERVTSGTLNEGGPNQKGPNQKGGGTVQVTNHVTTTIDVNDPFSGLTADQKTENCRKLYARWMTRRSSISNSCKKRMLACGENAYEYDEIALKDELRTIDEELKEEKARRRRLITEREKMIEVYGQCPECAMGGGSNRMGFGETLSNIMPYVRDMFASGMGTIMYNKYLRTGLSAYNKYMDGYNTYLGNNYQAYVQYISHCNTLGVPCDQYRGPMPGGFGGGMYGGGLYGGGMAGGIAGGIGFPGGMAGGIAGGIGYPGGMYGGGIAGGIVGGIAGGIGYPGGMYGGGIAGGIGYPGGMYGGGIGFPGGMYGGGIAGGIGYPGGMYGGGIAGGIGYPGGMYGGGIAGGIGYPGGMYGGGIGFPGGIAGGIGGGIGFPGGMAGGIGGGIYGGGIYGGGIAGGIGGGMGFPGGMGGGYDAGYLLNMQRQAMFQENSMIAQQQMMEAQLRYQNTMGSMYYGGGGIWGGGGLGYLNIGLGGGAYPYQSYPGMQNGTVPPLATPPYNPYSSNGLQNPTPN